MVQPGSNIQQKDAFDFLDESGDKNDEILNSFDLEGAKSNGLKRNKEESSDDDDDSNDDEGEEKKNGKKRKNPKGAKKGKFDSKADENDEANKGN